MPPLNRNRPALDLKSIRESLQSARGPAFWRKLEDLAGSPAFCDYLEREYPRFAAAPASLSRRRFMQLMAASLALAGLSGCEGPPPEQIVPYVHPPEGDAPEEPLFFATAMALDGYASGVLVESHRGRPTKVEGNPRHPASLGATDVFAQASVLELWDPDRSQTVLRQGRIGLWEEYLGALTAKLAGFAHNRGAGLRLLTETVTSPTLVAQLQALLERFPEARWHSYQPINRDNAYEGTRLAFGAPLEARYRFDKAGVILALDADFLGAFPGRLRYARQFAERRRVGERQEMNRLYAVESAPTITGAAADHHWPLRAGRIEAFARRVAHRLGLETPFPATDPGVDEAFIAALVKDLRRHQGAALVLAGERQPPAVHALAHAMNQALGGTGHTVTYSAPVVGHPGRQTQSLRALAADMAAGRVDTLLILGGNPVYEAPADLGFGEALAEVPFSCHLGLYRDETAALCRWHIPAAHYLEAWGDARAFDGTVTIQQPLIAPLYGGKTSHEILAVLLGETERDAYAIVRAHWRKNYAGEDFEPFWKRSLHAGFVESTSLPEKSVTIRSGFADENPEPAAGLDLVFMPDPTVWDGRFANNGWLQELPKPLLGLTWDNAALLGPELANKLGLDNESLVELRYRGRSVRAPVWVASGVPADTVALGLGYGRRRAGRVGDERGFDAYALRTADAPWFGSGVEVAASGERYPLAAVQHHHRMRGRDIARAATLAQYRADPDFARGAEPSTSLYPPYPYQGYKWGMAIDLTACIGCNACVVACQAENNIPVVGKTEVMRGREMHWLRVDNYYRGASQNPRHLFQPVPCMHCEQAPCELVCPVEATVHDSEGLNLQVYNRCVGTRFCSNNCPYKVRRFNFLQYVENTPGLNAQRNPEVTVRSRGVMEKCTYCIQRISAARISAEKENRRIQDGEVVTACQAVCPVDAIVFGDLNDPDSRVNRTKASPLDYALLGEINTRPRTSYLAKLVNPNPEIEKG